MKQIDGNNDKVWVEVTLTVNLGNYENVKFTSGASVTLDDEEDSEAAANDLFNTFEDLVLKRASEFKRNKK